MNHEDQLIDALLKEQARKREADESLLSSIEEALDDDGQPSRRTSRWKGALPLSLAAAVAIGGAFIYHKRGNFAPELAQYDAAEAGAAPAHESPEHERMRPTAMPLAEAKMEAESAAQGGETSLMEAPAAATPAQPGNALMDESMERAAKSATMGRDLDATGGAGREVGDAVVDGEIATLEVSPKPAPAADQLRQDPTSSDADTHLRGRVNIQGHTTSKEKVIRREVPAAPSEPLDQGSRGGLHRSVPARPADGAPVPKRLQEEILPRPNKPQQLDRENYGRLTDQPWKSPWNDPLSTFSTDVDTASYTNLRRMIRNGQSIQPDAVRIEECINYFDYKYPAPKGDSPFAVQSMLATCPWQPEHLLARVAIKGREIHNNARPASNLVFLIDVSGSMQSPDKLPMLKRSMRTLIDSLDERDCVGMVVYAGTEGVVLEPTTLDDAGKKKAVEALGKLEAGGSTNGGAGLYRAYQMALQKKVDGGVNRVILATDGDFNVGTTGQGQLVELVKGNAAKNVSLSVLGFGTGNLNDAMLEAITNEGNGNYFYIDGDSEAQRIFLQKLTGTLITIAKDVKIQIEFNPGKVKAYRLIGYANRMLRNEDFKNDKVDAGDIGAGHTVTAFYEIVPVGVDSPGTGDVDELEYQRPADRRELVESPAWLTLKLRYKHPEGEKSTEIKTQVEGKPVTWEEAGTDYRMASAVALFGMKLRQMPDVADVPWDKVEEIAEPALADDLNERRAEFLGLVKQLK
ncbi:magnesium-chelatase subunit protein [Haloferula helveola]|uniref:Magnesium-chelatase subunit protein n=1 Tax=Haloferula helveola TaxID=490095 RepID=A0ABM7RC57_9BACT|nr:magnesium-chelatase subunit protein [Haloferula helveola]